MRERAALCTWPALGLLVAAASCDVDDRGLSFQIALGSAPSTGAEAGASEFAGASAGETAPSQGGQAARAGTGGGATGGSQSIGASTSDGGQAEAPGGAPGAGGAGSHAGSNSSGGSTSGGSSVNGGTGGSGGSGGSGGDPDVEPGNFACGNLNRNGVDDCVETLVKNSRFDTSGADWDAESSLAQLWKPDNARGGSGSGSLLLTNTTVVPGGTGKTALASHQCVVAWGGDQFEVGARVHMAGGQGGGVAGINLIFYGNDGCDGTLLGGQDVAFASETDRWVVVRNQLSIPAGTRSARVRLTVAKPFAQPSLEAQFDDVLVVKL
jgi:hypothetical protein